MKNVRDLPGDTLRSPEKTEGYPDALSASDAPAVAAALRYTAVRLGLAKRACRGGRTAP